MLLRKINAVLSLVITVLLFNHAISCAVWMLSEGSIAKSESRLSWILAGFMVVHALMCIALGIMSHKGAKKSNYKNYVKLNASTWVQRITGVLMILFTGLHIAGAARFLVPPQIVHAILPPIFFFMSLSHVAVSTSKAFVTLGYGNARFIKIVDIAAKIICGLTFIAGVTGFYLYSFTR